MLTMWATCAAFVLLIQTFQCLASDDSYFKLINKDTGFCLIKANDYCFSIRWTTGQRLLTVYPTKCLGAQGKSVGSEISLYECDENSELQKWECKNETVLALKGQGLYIELKADNKAVLSKTIGPNNHLIIPGTTSGACARTHRELYTIGGNSHGRPCMFPFFYKRQWYAECIHNDHGKLWCATETKFENQLWGLCPVNTREDWNKHPTTGAYYQLNTQAALTWPQADASCKQQSASLLSISDPYEHAYVAALLGTGATKLWTGLVLDPEHGWQWLNGRPYCYLNWDSGHPISDPSHDCAIIDSEVQYSWQSSPCSKKLGYICYSKVDQARPTEVAHPGFCSRPWIPYNGHCFYLNRTQKSWANAQKECRKEGGDLVSIGNVEDQSFVISQLGYASTDELWIGLNDKKTERLFDWSDHSTVSFTSWEFGSPDISSEQTDCVLIRGENGNWADRACEEKHGYICMKQTASEHSGDEVELNAGCKAGWKKHGSYCYFVGTETKTFDEAKDHCKSSGSYLADVSNGVDNAFLVSLVGLRPEKHFWLGLSNQKDIDTFVWTNTNSVRFTHWNTLMPGHEQGCVAMKTGIYAGLWDVLPCTNKEKYICKHLKEGAVVTPAPPTVAPLKCAEGWTIVDSTKCLKFFGDSSSKKTWYEARDYCRAVGGDLLSIHSTMHLQGIYTGAWIGLSAPDPATGYVWSDGSPVNFEHWQSEEPNNQNNVESCVEYSRDGGRWNDLHCETPHLFLCQIRAGKTPKTPDPVTPKFNKTSDGWLVWNGNQYFINYNEMAMEEARRFCQKKHGDLVSIDSEAESVFLWQQIHRSYRSYWIGLRVELDATYEWMDGSQMVFQRWEEGQPDFKNYDENCAVMMNHNGFWHDYNCGHEHGSICKRSGSPPVNTTRAPPAPPKGGCPTQWKQIESRCYNVISNAKVTWDGARQQCKAMGGNLASIPSRKVAVFLTTQMADTPTTDLWIGLRSLGYDPFLWTDGQPRSYVNFAFTRNRYGPFGSFHSPYRRMHRHYRSSIFFNRGNKLTCVVMTTDPQSGIGKWVPKSCNDTNGFICLRKVDPAFPDIPDQTFADYVKLGNDSFKVVTQNKSWVAAKDHCERDGAKIASLNNEWKQTYVELMALTHQTPLWIGLNRKETNGYFRYIDGWPLTFTKWYYGEPRTDIPCVYVDVDGTWKTAYCNETMNSVCMKTTDVPPTESSEFPGVCPELVEIEYQRKTYAWIQFKGYCYLFVTDHTSWPEAAAICLRHGGSLASIGDPYEQNFIQTNVKIYEDSTSYFWIGLHKTHKGVWSWLDNTIMDYTNWFKTIVLNEPADYMYGVITTSNGTWKRSTRNSRPYICKVPKVILPTPMPTSHVTDLHTRGHIALAGVLVIAGIVGIVIALFLYKKLHHRLPVPVQSNSFENPLFTDTKVLVNNAEEENPEPTITL